MAKGVRGEFFIPSETAPVGHELIGEVRRMIRDIRFSRGREEPSGRSAAGEPVFRKEIESLFREDGVAVGPVLGMPDMDMVLEYK